MPGGRPTKYRHEYCQELIAHMEKGYSYTTFAGHIGVNPDTLYSWERRFSEFSETKKIALSGSLVFWERLGLEGLFMGSRFKATVWIMNMRNRFGWNNGGRGAQDGYVDPGIEREPFMQAMTKEKALQLLSERCGHGATRHQSLQTVSIGEGSNP